jgi:hypothetical protein
VQSGKDGRTVSFSTRGKVHGLALGSPVTSVFVTGSTSDDMLIKHYEKITNPTLSSNKTRNSLLTSYHTDIPPEATNGDGPYGSGSIAASTGSAP